MESTERLNISLDDIMKTFTSKIKSTPLLCPKCKALPLITISQQKLTFVNFYCFCGYEYNLNILKLFNVDWIDNITLTNFIIKGGNILDPKGLVELKKERETLFTECVKIWEEVIFSSLFFVVFPVNIESECKEHSLKYEHFCRECSSHLCSTCYTTNHKEHSTEQLNTIVNKETLDKKLLTFKDAMSYIINTNLNLYKKMNTLLEKKRLILSLLKKDELSKEITDLSKEQMNLANDMSLNARVIDCMGILYKFCLKLYKSMKTPCNYFILKNMKELSYFHIEHVEFKNDIDESETTKLILQRSLSISGYLMSHFLLNNKEEGDYFSKYKVIIGSIPLDVKYIKCVNSREYGKHKVKINSILVLSNGNIAVAGDHPTIKIFDKEYMRCDMKFAGHTQQVNYLCELDKKHFVSCSDDKSIIIWSFKSALCRMELMLKLSSKLAEKEIVNEHTAEVLQVLAYGVEPFFVSLSKDKTIKVFSYFLNKCKLKHTFSLDNNCQFKAMCYIPGEILATVSDDNVLRLWDLLLYAKMPTYFENIECAYQNSMKMLDNKTLLVGSERGFVIIDLRFMAVIQRVVMEELLNVNSFVILNSGYFITGSASYFYLYEYNINEAKLLLKTPNNHSDAVGVVVKQDAKHFVSGGFDSVIKVWEIVYDE